MNEASVSKKYFIGRSAKGIWSSVYTYRPHNLELREKRGEVFAVILLKGPPDFSLSTAGGMLLDRFHESYFENRSDSALVAMEKAAKETSHYLQKMLENDQADKDGVDLNLTALTVLGDLVFILSIGEGKIYIHRDDELNEISSELKDPTGEGIVKEASFVAKRGDVYLLGTEGLEKQVNKQEIVSAAEDFTEGPFKNKLYEDESSVALMLIGYNIDRKHKVIPEVKIEEVEAEEVEEKEEEVVEEIEQVEQDDELIDTNFGLDPDDDLTIEELVKKENQVREEGTEVIEEVPLPEASEVEVKEVLEEAEELGPIETGLVKKEGIMDRVKTSFKSIGMSMGRIFKKKSGDVNYDRLAKVRVDKERAEMKTYQVVLLRIWEMIVSFFKGLKGLVWDKWLGLGMNTDDMYLRSAARKRRYGFLAVLIVIVIAILYSSIKGAVENQQVKEQEELAGVKLSEIEVIVSGVEEQAQYLVAATGSDERKVKALTSLDEADALLDELELTGFLIEDINALRNEIILIRNKFNRIISVVDVTLLADLGDTFPGAAPSDITHRNQKVYVSDSKFGTIYSFDYSGNNRAEIASGFTNPKSITVDEDNNTLIVLDDNPDNALSIINLANNSLTKMAATSQSKLAGTTVIESALINSKEPRLYLLNPEAKSMSYYIRSGSTYGTLVNRNNSDDLTNATDFKIDEGRIYYTMQKNSGLYKDFNKAEDKVNILNMSVDDNFINATALYVDGQYIYIGDPLNRRVLVFVKGAPDISLIAQYKYQGEDENMFKNIKEVTADRVSNKLFVLDGSKILTLDMNLLTDFTIN